jgi:hypothetical protein
MCEIGLKFYFLISESDLLGLHIVFGNLTVMENLEIKKTFEIV